MRYGTRLTGSLALGVLLWAILLGLVHSLLLTTPNSSILSIELSPSSKEFANLVGFGQGGFPGLAGAADAKNIPLDTSLDFVLVLLYWAFFTCLAALFADSGPLPNVLKIFATLAAGCGVGENICILMLVHLAQQHPLQFVWTNWPNLPVIASAVSWGKWGAFFIALLLSGVLMVRYRLKGIGKTPLVINGAIFWTTALAGLAGCFHPAFFVGAATALLGLGLIWAVNLFLTATPPPEPAAEHEEGGSPQAVPGEASAKPGGALEYPGGGGDDAVCFTAGPQGAYFGAGVIHAYLAARRKHPVVAAGISAGAINAAAMQRCFREMESAPPGDQARRWSWFRRYIQVLTDSPLAPVWAALPDMSDFFADMPPVRDTSLPPSLEVKARRQRYILIKLGRRLATLPLSVRRVTEAIVYFVRTREAYGHLSAFRLTVRLYYLLVRISLFISAPVLDNFYKESREDGKEPSIIFGRPLFGMPITVMALSVCILHAALLVTALACIVLIALQRHEFLNSDALATGAGAVALFYILVGVAKVGIVAQEYPAREKLAKIAGMMLGSAAIWVAGGEVWYFWKGEPVGAQVTERVALGCWVLLYLLMTRPTRKRAASPETGFWEKGWEFGKSAVVCAVMGAALVAIGLFIWQAAQVLLPHLPAGKDDLSRNILLGLGRTAAIILLLALVELVVALLLSVCKFREETRGQPETGFLLWCGRVFLETVGLSRGVISDFYILQRLKHLFDPVAEKTGSYSDKLGDWPMPVLLVASSLQSLPTSGHGKTASQQLWARPGTNLVEALRASIAVPGLLEPVVAQGKEAEHWLHESHGGQRLDLVDGAVIRQNPLPALFRYLDQHMDLARKLYRHDDRPSVHVVFNVPLGKRQAVPGSPLQAPSNVVDVALLSLKLAHRRDTNLEMRQANSLSDLERIIIESGAESCITANASGSYGGPESLKVLPLKVGGIAPEKDIDVGSALDPDRDKTLAVIAEGCRLTMQRLYHGELLGFPETRCSAMLARVWLRQSWSAEDMTEPPGRSDARAVWPGQPGQADEVTEPPGLSEVCRFCTGILCRPEQPGKAKLGLSHHTFSQLTGLEPRVVFVASGGVFRGAFQAGVLAGLLQAKVGVDLVVGASVGTLMGGALAAAASSLGPDRKKVVRELVETLAKVDERVALTAVLKSATRELGVRGRSIHLSPRDVQRMIRRGSRFDPGYTVTGAPPALLDAISTLLVIPYAHTKKLASDIVSGSITQALGNLLRHLREDTLPSLGIREYLMGVSLLRCVAERLLLVAHGTSSLHPQPYLNSVGKGVALFGVSTNLATWESKLLGNPAHFDGSFDLIEAVLSSSAFPSVFQPRREADIYPGLGDQNIVYADGGMFDNLPFFSAIDVLESVQTSYVEEHGPDDAAEALTFARKNLQRRHEAPDLFIVGSLEAEPDTALASAARYDSIVSVLNRAGTLNSNLKITDFQLYGTQVHNQVERLLQVGQHRLPHDCADFLNRIVEGAVLPVFPADGLHLNPTFAFCRTLGLDQKRIKCSIGDGCFQTLAAIAKAQAYRPQCCPPPYDPFTWQATTPDDVLSRSVWALVFTGKLPYLERPPALEGKPHCCPFFQVCTAPVAGNPIVQKVPTEPFPCPFAGDDQDEAMWEVFAICRTDQQHKGVDRHEKVSEL